MDEITLTFPAKPDYISVARLTTSGIAHRAGLNIDEIEDLKVAVSEAAIYIMNQGLKQNIFKLTFQISNCEICVSIETDDITDVVDKRTCDEQNKLSLFIIESLMDKVDMASADDVITKIILHKKYGGKTYNDKAD